MQLNAVKWCYGVLLATFLIGLQGCTPQPTPNQLDIVKERQVIRVGTLMNPTSFFYDHEREQGFEYELAQRFANRMGVELQMVPRFDVADLFTLLQRGEIDIVAAGLDETAQRRALFRFGPPYDEISHKLIFKQGSRQRPRDWAQVDDGEVVVVTGSSHEEFLRSIEDEFPKLKWRSTSEHDAVELMRMVDREEIDYTIADSNQLEIQRRAHPGLSVAFTTQRELAVAWAMKDMPDDSLYAAVIEYFGEVRESGRLAYIKEKHFGHVKQFNYVTTRLFIDAVEQQLPKYINLFKQHSGKLDWRLLAAISYQESLWNPRAVSPTGVRGMMMLTLPTAKAMGVQSRLNAEQSIRGGARYFERMLQRIPARIPEPDRTWFALAAYNIGFGHLEDARVLTQRQGGNPDRWLDVKKRLPLLRQKQFYRQTKFGFARGDEPVTYVGNIRRFYDTLKWLDKQGRL